MSSGIEYGKLMHAAMRGLIRRVLLDVQSRGLPGDHHFFITFDTAHPGVEIASWLAERYPGEMTVVMQHWYDDLEVTAEGFSVTLNFGDSPEHLSIPFAAIRTFVDPSVEFGLRFETHDDASTIATILDADEDDDEDDTGPSEAPERPSGDAEIVSLDKFRK